MKSRWLAPLVCLAGAISVVMVFNAARKQSVLALRTNMLAASQRYPKFTMAQRLAVLREWQSETHPLYRDLSLAEAGRRLLAAALASSATAQSPNASFFGNLTAINATPTDLLGMKRTSTCSLTEISASYSLSLPTFTYTIDAETPNYDQLLHSEAGLTTTGGTWPSGCGDPVTGLPSRKVIYVGLTSGGYKVYADAFYDAATGNQELETVVANASTDATVSSALITDIPNPINMVSADLNGDGNPDLVVMSDPVTAGGSVTLSVLLGNADGTFGNPTNYNFSGENGEGVVIDDFNNDGKLDIVASSLSFSSGTATYELAFLEGNGDGTFQTAQAVALTPPSTASDPVFGLISADLRNNGNKDLISSAGVVLFGNGNGTFTQSSTPAFPSEGATSEYGPEVAAGDFNKDGIVDLALDNGLSISLYLGKGDGTFTPAGGYATIDNTGYLTATDLDGDGNPDLYSGIANAGMFGGDQFEFAQGYALMGNGNGTFQGAPEMPFVFTGTNLMDLNNDGIPDGVGVNATLNSTNISITSYLGKSNGSFTTGTTLDISPFMLSGTSYSFSSLDSFGLGDTRGNGDADLVYLPESFYAPGGVTGYFLALGNGNGSFNTPVFVTAPTFAPSGDFDLTETIDNLFVADVNGDGKADVIYSYSNQVFQTGIYTQGVAVQLSNGDGTFQAPQTIQTYSSTTAPTGPPPFVAQIGRTRPNGALDLFLETLNSSTATTSLQLYLGKGDGTFGSPSTPPVADNIGPPSFGAVLGQIALADMNDDGKPDLITLGTTGNGAQAELAISLGNGDGTFATPNILDFGGGSSLGYGLAAADFNNDGKIDVAVTGFNPPVDTGIFLGNGDGTVQSFSTGSGQAEPAEGINLIVYGAAATANFGGSNSLPDLVAGSAVLIDEGSSGTTPPPALAAITSTLTASATTISAGSNVTFTDTVAPASGTGTPTGTVTFELGGVALGTATLSGGTATYSTAALPVGTNSITALYSGDSSYSTSTSNQVTVIVQSVPSSFTVAASPTSATVSAGSSTMTTITVTPAGGFNSPVNFSCSGLPSGGSCSFSSNTVTPTGAGTATTTLTIATAANSSALTSPRLPGSPSRGAATLALLAGAVCCFWRRRDLPWTRMLPLALVLLTITAVIAGCGGSKSSAQPQTYSVTITGTAGSENQTATFALTIQ